MPLTRAFESYASPVGALSVRCHVLKQDHATALEDFLVQKLPECYATKAFLRERVATTGLSVSEILANKLPDRGNVMSGDFGEVLTLFFLSSERSEPTKLIKKWQYKQDRQKPAPHSDVIIFSTENPSTPSPHDFVICAESKQKATASNQWFPISAAFKGYETDKIGRLARTLAWLREKAIDQGSTQDIALIERFAIGTAVEYSKYFKAVAIIDRSLLDAEITWQIDLPAQDASFEVVVLGISELKQFYETVYERAQREVTLE